MIQSNAPYLNIQSISQPFQGHIAVEIYAGFQTFGLLTPNRSPSFREENCGELS